MLTDSEKIFRAAMAGESDETLAEVFSMPVEAVRDTVRKEFAQRMNLMGEVSFSNPTQVVMKGQPVHNPSILVTRKGMSIYDQMRRDEQVKAALKLKKHSVLASGFDFRAPEGKTDQWEILQFVKDNLENRLEHGLTNALLGIMSAMDYGYSISEKVFQPHENRIILAKIKTRRPHEFRFEVDPHGNLLGLYQDNAYGNHNKSLPVPKFVIYSYQKEWGNFYGTSDLEAVYTPWWAKTNAIKWLSMLLERFGIPPVFGLYNPGRYTTEQQRMLQLMLERLQAGTSGTIPRNNPADFELWSPELADQAASVFIPALDHYDKMIAKGLLMPDMLGVTPQQNVGSMAQAKVHFDSFMLIIQHIQGEIEEIVNEQIVRPLVDMNFSTQDYPEFHFLPMTDEDRVNLMKEWREHVRANSVTNTAEDENHIRQTLRFPEKSPEEIEAERKKRQQDQMDIAAKQKGFKDGSESGNRPEKDSKKGNPQDTKPTNTGKLSLADARAPTVFESRLDLQAIQGVLEGHEAQIVTTLQGHIEKALERWFKRMQKDGVENTLGLLILPRKKMAGDMKRLLKEVFNSGMADLNREVKGAEFALDEVFGKARTAGHYLGLLAEELAAQTENQIMTAARLAALRAVELGESATQAQGRIKEALMPYLEPQERAERTAPHRLATMARTHTTSIYNRGRLAVARSEHLRQTMRGMQYSAILDNRTTELCEGLDGLIFRINDPELDRLTPPNHFNCRSLLVPVTIADEVDDSMYASHRQIGRAKDMMKGGFL